MGPFHGTSKATSTGEAFQHFLEQLTAAVRDGVGAASESTRKYRRDAKEKPDKEIAPRVSLTRRSVQGEAFRDVPTDHDARCRQKQLTSCKTKESLEDSALGGTCARGEREQEVLSRQSRKTIAGVMTLVTNTRPVTLATMVQASTWASEPLDEQHHTAEEV